MPRPSTFSKPYTPAGEAIRMISAADRYSSDAQDVPLTGPTSDRPLSGQELPSRFSSLRDVAQRSPPASTLGSPPRREGRRFADKEKSHSRIWKAISTRSKRSAIRSQCSIEDITSEFCSIVLF